ncbi:hypothetical protein GCM10022222_76640 [Amycolatopsis ultiminotia]|uniref:DUF6596 domain-containing protein n=1 Tax=Amycolatopsis ultiminotia TaxID=543629 RepID=A0ABP6YD12_9PSEU
MPEATMTRRITRAKESIAAAGAAFAPPSAEDRPARLRVVLQVLYLIFNEGYVASSGDQLHRVEPSEEEVRLPRDVHAPLPGDGEVTGLLYAERAAGLQAAARRGGQLVPLAEQDRRKWTVPHIVEGWSR